MAATSTHLSMVPPAPASSCLTTHISRDVAILSPLTSHLCFAGASYYLLFQVPQLQSLLLQVWRTRSTHTLLPGGAGLSQGGQLCPCIACIPRPSGKVTSPSPRQQQLPRVNPSVNPRGPCQPDMAILGEASPAANSPWEPSSPNQAQDKPALAALSAATTLALARPQGQGEEQGSQWGPGRVPAGFWGCSELGTPLPSLCSLW